MKRTILIVDDMAIFREPIEAVLRANDYQVVTASNGVEALAAISRTPPDLIVLDLDMPVMDGVTTLKRLRGETATRRIPVLILSVETDRARIVEAMRLGIAGYLLKSQFSVRILIDRVNSALEVSNSSAGEANADPGAGPPAVLASVTPKPAATSKIAADATSLSNAETKLKSLQPLMARADLSKRISEIGELTSFSPAISQVLKVISSDKCSMEHVAKVVSQDHALSLKVLKLANSSAYSRGDRVDTVQKALLRIGMQSIRQAVLNIGVLERFGAIAANERLHPSLFWEHGVACGIIAAELAHALKHKEPDAAFTAGLLHDLGRMLFAEHLSESYTQVLNAAQTLQLPLERVESQLLRITHAEAMDQVLRRWSFPRGLINPIVHHHAEPRDVKSLAPHQSIDVLRLGLADRLAHAMMLGSSGNDTIYPTEEHCRLLSVAPEMIQSIQEHARQQTDDTKVALLVHSNAANWQPPAEHYRSMLRAPFRPLYVSASPAFDAYRIFCNELAGPSSTQVPNVAIVHLTRPKDRAALEPQVTAQEQAAGVPQLPLLVLSPSGEINFDDRLLLNRQTLLLSTPLTINRFIAALNEILAANERVAA